MNNRGGGKILSKETARREWRLSELYLWLKSCAAEGEQCPNIADISSRFYCSLNTASDLICELHRRALIIRHARKGVSPVVVIVATGAQTAGDIGGKASLKTLNKLLTNSSSPAFREDLYAHRDPCTRCGVPANRHTAVGCASYWHLS